MEQESPSAAVKLYNLISIRNVSEDAKKILRDYLLSFNSEKRKIIINTHLIKFHERTSVHLTAEMDQAPFLQILLENGGDPNAVTTMTDLMQTPLHLAAQNGCWECVDLLLKHGAYLYEEDMHKNTPYDYMKDTPNYKKMMEEKAKQKIKKKQDILQAMYKAREDRCTIKVRYGKVLLCGANGAGKTNFLNLIMKEKFNPKHISTEVAKPHQATIVVKAQVVTHNKEVTFKIMNIDDEIDHLMLYLPIPKNYTRPSIQEESNLQQVQTADNQESTTTQDQKSPTLVEDIMSRKFASNNALEQPPEETWDIFTFIDTGGQPQFISLLPVVNVSAMITFIVHKMKKEGKIGINQKFEVQHKNKKGKNSFSKHTYECTYLQLIKTLISHASVNLQPDERFDKYIKDHDSKKSYKSISFIGTHSQDISENKISEIDEVLYETINYNNNACLENIKRDLNEHYTYIIPVDNKKQNTSSSTYHGNSKKFTDVSKIRSYIYKCIQHQNVYTVPIQWLLLDLEIRKKCEKEESNFITYSDVLKLAEEKNLGKGNFIECALRFHHFLGVLLYFEDVDGMRELVITNHQWLFEKLTEIVLYSFTSDKNKEFEDLKKGIFNETMLNKLNIDKDFEKCRINSEVIDPKKSFLNLLQHLLIIASLKEDATKYFMPTLLSSCDLNNLQRIIPGGNHFKALPNGSEPLLIQFEFTDKIDGFPRGFFCFLVVQLIHSGHWELYKENAKQNLITFFINDYSAYYVTLIDKIFFLEVHVTHKSNDIPPIHHEVFKTIKRSLTVVEERLHIVIKLKVGFLCKKCQDTPEEHITYLPENISERRYCLCTAQEPTELERSHEVWLSAEDTEEDPDPKEIYYQFYPELVSSLPMKDAIFLSHLIRLLPDNLKEKVESKSTSAEAASYFLDKIMGPAIVSGNNEPFNLLLKIMETSDNINLNSLAQNIRKEIQRNESVTGTSEEGHSSSASPTQQATSTITKSKGKNQPAGTTDIFERYPRSMEKLSLKPTYTELIEQLNVVRDESWKTIAMHLLPGSKVEAIEKNYHDDIQKCHAEMLREYYTSGVASWEVVIEALTKAGEKNTADKIKEQLATI